MKKKKLVIFFLALIPLYLIYQNTYNEEYIYLVIGDDLAKGHTPFDTYGISYADYLYNYLKDVEENVVINKNFIEEDIRVEDLIKEIKSSSNSTNLSQAIKKADLITISIGSEELFSKIRSNYILSSSDTKKMYNFIDDLTKDLENLIKEIKKLTNKSIYLIGFYNPVRFNENTKLESLFNYIDVKMKTIENEYEINYVPIYEGFKEKEYYLPNKNHAFPSLEGYNYIANQLIEKIKES